jgi:hypothetical protein
MGASVSDAMRMSRGRKQLAAVTGLPSMAARTPQIPLRKTSMKLLTAIIAAVGLLACGCATTTVEPVALERVSDFKLSYSGELGRNLVGDLPQYTRPESETALVYALEVRILKGRAIDAEALFGKRVHTVGAWSMQAQDFDFSTMQTVAAPQLTVFEGQNGTISVNREIAYISGFEVTGGENSRVADPVVETVVDGLMLGLNARTADETQMRLAVDLVLAEVVRPIASQQINVLGAPVTIQTPVIYSQRLKGEGHVSEDRVLVLTGMLNQGEVYVILITGKRAELSDIETPEEK